MILSQCTVISRTWLSESKRFFFLSFNKVQEEKGNRINKINNENNTLTISCACRAFLYLTSSKTLKTYYLKAKDEKLYYQIDPEQ